MQLSYLQLKHWPFQKEHLLQHCTLCNILIHYKYANVPFFKFSRNPSAILMIKYI